MTVDDLYQEIIFDHNRRPRNFGPLEAATRGAEGYNPLCGDRLTLHLRLVDDRIEQARFEGSGCAISTASASLMTEALQGLTVAQAQSLSQRFMASLTSPEPPPDDEALGKLRALAGVRDFPARIKCATLAWHTLLAALRNSSQTVSTEGGDAER